MNRRWHDDKYKIVYDEKRDTKGTLEQIRYTALF